MIKLDRRSFLAGAGGAVASAALPSTAVASANRANRKVVLALMGLRNRGPQLVERFKEVSDVEIAYVCDCDERQFAKGVDAVASRWGKSPKVVKDYRIALDDSSVDGLICAAPNHWHAAATITACQAGKHVYVEKPCSHTAEEGELMIAAAAKHSRVVQVGMQRRSGPLYRKMVERVREGAIGEVLLGKSFYFRSRPSVGHAEPETPPSWLDFDLWQGPVTERPYRSNILHYNWHGFWHWGDAEIGNNGVHTIDICRWAMGVDFPNEVAATGAKLRHNDDWEMPDTLNASFKFGKKLITWEGVSWSDPYQMGMQIGIELRGTAGTLFVNDRGYTMYDLDRKPFEQEKESRGDIEHCQDFVDCIRAEHQPNGKLEDGHRSAMLCHLANIAYRTGETLTVNPRDGHLSRAGKNASALWSSEYREKWMPNV